MQNTTPASAAAGALPGAPELQQANPDFLQRMYHTMQQMHNRIQQLEDGAPAFAAAPAAAPGAGVSPLAAMQLASLAPLEPFDGRPSQQGRTANPADAWLRKAEGFFALREEAMQLSSAAAAVQLFRVRLAASRLQGPAQQWYESLDASGQAPTTWPDFRTLFLERFSPVASTLLHWDQLKEISAQAKKLRSMSLVVLTGYISRFLDVAAQLPASAGYTDVMKMHVFADGLPERLREKCFEQLARGLQLEKQPADPVSGLAQTKPFNLATFAHKLLATHANREYAYQSGAAGAGASSSRSSASASAASADALSDPMDLSSMQRCVDVLGLSPADVAGCFADSEGWAPCSTAAPSSSSSSSSSAPLAAMGHFGPGAAPFYPPHPAAGAAPYGYYWPAGPAAFGPMAAAQLNALHTQRPSRDRRAEKAIPDDIADKRKKAGLCIRCGVRNFVKGNKGHNARTCKAPAPDLTTSVQAGRAQADAAAAQGNE